ncbi:MAG: Lrp/AsnC family transcriptional regulator [Thermoplasmata archaeon]
MVSKIDKRIIELLQQDARMPITRIAKEVNMSENGVKYRLEKLEQKGVIRTFSILIDPKKVGKNVMAMFSIEFKPEEMRHNVRLLTTIPELIKIYHTTGEYSIMAIGLFDSNDELTKFINHKLLVDFSVQKYAMDVVTRQYKDSIYMI